MYTVLSRTKVGCVFLGKLIVERCCPDDFVHRVDSGSVLCSGTVHSGLLGVVGRHNFCLKATSRGSSSFCGGPCYSFRVRESLFFRNSRFYPKLGP